MKVKNFNEMFTAPFSFYGYIPFNNKYANLLSKKLVEKLSNGEIKKVSYDDHAYLLDLGFDKFNNVLFMKGIFSTRNFILLAAAMDAISMGANRTYMLSLNDGSDDIVFINKRDGKMLFDLCESITNKKCGVLSVGVNSSNQSDNNELEQKVKYILQKLTNSKKKY